jgi:hypothetical protein
VRTAFPTAQSFPQKNKKNSPPAVARAARPGRCGLRVRCRCAALLVLCYVLHWLCLIAVRKALLLSDLTHSSQRFSHRCYGWIPHNAGFGFLDIARPTLGQIYF